MADKPLGRALPVPSGRLARFARLGGMTSGIVANMAATGLGQAIRGQRPAVRDLLMTPANITRVADQLARMRGAAMKVGQLISMDTGDVLPPELAAIMARLRQDAHHMPPRQVKRVLADAWGTDWLRHFQAFDPTPIAAASIGQVHRAVTRDGRALAIKVQYPGVRRSISSDVDNVATLIRMSGLVPHGVDLSPLMAEAKRQLHEEADYRAEAAYLTRFQALLAGDPDFAVPALETDLVRETVLPMGYCDGVAIETRADAPQAERDRIVRLLLRLFLRELFEFGLMQTDPNFANYRYDPATGRVVLLDFGASRAFGEDVRRAYRTLLAAGMGSDRGALQRAAEGLGLFDAGAKPHIKETITDMLELVFTTLRVGPVDFADRDLSDRLQAAGMALAEDQSFAHIPPMDVLYLQRKAGGLYLLARQLRARVDLRPMIEETWEIA